MGYIIFAIVFVAAMIAFFWAAFKNSAHEEKYAEITYQQMMEKRKHALQEQLNGLYCMCFNRPIQCIDFSVIEDCEPEKCLYCNLSVHRDLE